MENGSCCLFLCCIDINNDFQFFVLSVAPKKVYKFERMIEKWVTLCTFWCKLYFHRIEERRTWILVHDSLSLDQYIKNCKLSKNTEKWLKIGNKNFYSFFYLKSYVNFKSFLSRNNLCLKLSRLSRFTISMKIREYP